MNSKRLFRLAVVGGAVAAAVAAVRALTRENDPLPAPADGPSQPWPPLRAATDPVAPKPLVNEDGEAVEPQPALSVVEPEPAAGVESAAEEASASEPAAAPEPAPAGDKPPTKGRRTRPLRATWMPPNADGSCPEGYPLKANEQSMIFHAPGQMSYDRTVPERCYAEADAAVADGFRAAKR